MDNIFGTFSLGKKTLEVSMELHRETRQKLLKGLATSGVDPAQAAVLLEGGKLECRHDTDHEVIFRQESYFHYLFGVREPDCYGFIELSTGESYLFVPRLPESYAVWMGKIHPPEHFAKVYSVDHCFYVDELASVLKQRNVNRVLILDGVNTDSGERHKGANFSGKDQFKVDTEALFPVLQECRVKKTQKEIELMRYVAQLSCEAHKAVMRAVRPGMMEYELESLFRHRVYADGGCRFTSYTCICASGENASILHYGHAGAPNARLLQDGDMLMFDMGGEYACYGADISRSFPANGKFTQGQREIYSTVLAAQEAVMKTMKPGVSYPDLHRLADRVLCTKLKEYGFLQGDVDEMMANFVGSIFMPHGLGHLLGIDTHDVGGYKPGMARSSEPGLKSLRLGRVLEEGMVLTVEPGCYFNPATLVPAMADPKLEKFFVKEKINQFLDFGGVRIEDDVVVTADGIENLSRFCPRAIDEIEALMAEERKDE